MGVSKQKYILILLKLHSFSPVISSLATLGTQDRQIEGNKPSPRQSVGQVSKLSGLFFLKVSFY